ncbi:DUF397 domain-containing protein [Streptomyces sp. NPDC048442]|uniref:DUF397 domain-containing protein n=1 Tax=Streptomyces sp. NPDC048442 TaxID=3154823 RepID=UPI0034386987
MTHKPASTLSSTAVRENWFKSSYSGGEGSSCVEIADLSPTVGVRDSKLGNDSPVTTVSRTSWTTFIAHLAQ